MLDPFLIALQFLTRLPVRPRWSDEATGRSLLYYPLVGLLIGLALALLAIPLAGLAPGLGAALLLTVWVLISGGLHLDGLADSADAWLGGQGDRERTLEIMKDPACGPAGVLALVLVLLVKWQALALLLVEGAALPLVLAAVLARAALLALFYTTDYVRPGGLGSALARYLPRSMAAKVLAVVVVIALLAGLDGVAALTAAAIIAGGARWLMQRRLGGTTGDTAGALLELVEAAVLVGLSL